MRSNKSLLMTQQRYKFESKSQLLVDYTVEDSTC